MIPIFMECVRLQGRAKDGLSGPSLHPEWPHSHTGPAAPLSMSKLIGGAQGEDKASTGQRSETWTSRPSHPRRQEVE